MIDRTYQDALISQAHDLTMTPIQQTRQAHIQSALGLRRTAHNWMRRAIEWPNERERYMSEAKRLLSHARWDLSRVRNIDAYEEWRETR